MWTIETARGTIILVGEIVEVPESTPWQPERLEDATSGAQTGHPRNQGQGLARRHPAAPLLRRKAHQAAQGKRVAADYLDDAQQRRLAALEERYDQDYSRQSFLITGLRPAGAAARFNRDTGKDASDVVRRAADRADVPAEPVGTLRGEDMLDSLFAAPPESHLPCLDAAMTATEQGPGLIEQRGADWRAYDVPAVMANPLEIALGRCWPWTDQQVGDRAARAVDRRDLPRGRCRRRHARRRPAARPGRTRWRPRPARAARPRHCRPRLALSADGLTYVRCRF